MKQPIANLNSLLTILQSPADATTIRRDILSCLCKTSGASAAFLLLFEEEPRLFSYGRIVLEKYKAAVQDLAHSPDLILHQRNISLLKLHYASKPLGMIGLLFKNRVNRKPFESLLIPVLTIVSLFEHRQKLLSLLEISQNSLRNLAGQSTSIARNNTRLFGQLTANIDRLQGMSKGVIRMQEEERSKISRELHDGIGQALTALKMNLDFVTADLGKQISPESRQQLEDARKLAEQSLTEVRELSRLLRPRMLDDLGLLPTLRWLARTFSKRTGIKVALETNGSRPKLDTEIETMLFRIAQEALNNVAKHSQSKTARVTLACLPRRIRLKIEDTGVGFDASTMAKVDKEEFGSGLSGIRDRVTLWGGKFSIHSRAGSGTNLNVEIPVKRPLVKRKHG
jgi:signal transduction histidine kinase